MNTISLLDETKYNTSMPTLHGDSLAYTIENDMDKPKDQSKKINDETTTREGLPNYPLVPLLPTALASVT